MITQHPFNTRLFSELNRFVTDALEPAARCENGECDLPDYSGTESISNDTEGWKLRLELPGYRKGEVKLTIEEGFVNILAETDDEERAFLGTEKRRVRISEDVDAKNIQARLEDGILYLEIPRKLKAEPKPIVIK